MELATPHHPDRARRLTRPARLIGAHLQLGGKIEKSSLWPRWSSLPAVRRDDSCLERNRAPRGPQRMLTLKMRSNNLKIGKVGSTDIFSRDGSDWRAKHCWLEPRRRFRHKPGKPP